MYNLFHTKKIEPLSKLSPTRLVCFLFLFFSFNSFAQVLSCTQSYLSYSGFIIPNYINSDLQSENENKSEETFPGAYQTTEYFPILKGKNIAIVANQTSLVEKTHLVDSLISAGILVKKIFCPEHGFRGTADAGEIVSSTTDKKTGLPIISLYGKNKKPSPEQLKGIDIVVFDIQDVGVRFYTYISTMHYVMEACAEKNIPLLILDRPNPNIHYIDGPVLKSSFKSFVGMHQVPLVYGMTIAEYAQMINGEGWLAKNVKCKLQIVKCKNYNHNTRYTLPVKPSPNLPNMRSVYLYPSLGLFEGTNVSVGRGTEFPFQVLGSPFLDSMLFHFIPKSSNGAKNPMYENKKCYGVDLRNSTDTVFTLKYIINMYKMSPNNETFFNPFFQKLIGTDEVIPLIKAGKTEAEIKTLWQNDLNKFKEIRKKYLLYP
ncbi:MAG: DUF1343 domain-containing protein [Bacteroidia bacterium]|nr:DUF1343 domain-containing protein [Bacteroidia bacterium]